MTNESVPNSATPPLKDRLQTLPNETLLAIVQNPDTIKRAATDELIARGIGPDGQWHTPAVVAKAWHR